MCFCKDNRNTDKLQSVCKKCKSTTLGEYYKLHPEKRYPYKYTDKIRIKGLKQYHKHSIHYNVSRMIREGLGNSKKSKPTFELLNYSIQELKDHLEKQFTSGMTWENYGKYGWHIDHKIPRSKLIYDSVDHPNFKLCWELKNLQPLWSQDNWRKGNKILAPSSMNG